MVAQAPVVDGRAVIHLKSVAFGFFNVLSVGENVMGVNQYMDIERTMDVVANKSNALRSHMQRDNIYADLGYITSSGQNHIFQVAFFSNVYLF